MKKIKNILKKSLDIVVFCLGVKGNEIEKEAISEKLVSRDGQGRDKYGR